MANPDHVERLRAHRPDEMSDWNIHRPESPDLTGANFDGLDLRRAELAGANFSDASLVGTQLQSNFMQGAFFSGADLRDADMSGGNLYYARFVGADMRGARLSGARLLGATLDGANLTGASLASADLRSAHMLGTRLVEADLTAANLTAASLMTADLSRAVLRSSVLAGTSLVQATVTGAIFDGSFVYGVGAWDLDGAPASSRDLVITRVGRVTVADLKMAQFIYLLLENAQIRDVIDAVATKSVLILGRFTSDRKAVLNRLRDELQRRNFMPILFDFEPSIERDITETVTLLARMARFIIADLTDPSSIPQELQAIAPHVAVPIQPLLLASAKPWSMFQNLEKYQWVLPIHSYQDEARLIAELDALIHQADLKRQQIRGPTAGEPSSGWAGTNRPSSLVDDRAAVSVAPLTRSWWRRAADSAHGPRRARRT